MLEHVGNPLAVLRQLAVSCRPGGFLVVGVPRFDTLPVHRDYKYVINTHAHIAAYTWTCLDGLLARAGWEPVGAPPDQVKLSGGRLTAARMRRFGGRVDGDLPLPARPLDAAREALRLYYAGESGRSLAQRLTPVRVAARLAETRGRSGR